MQIEAQIAAHERPQSGAFFERRLYDTSPLGLFGTTVAIFLALIGLYAIAATADHQSWIVLRKAGPAIDRRTWVAVCLSLIASAALGLQRFSWRADERDAPAFARALRTDANVLPVFSKTRLRFFTLIGGAIGAAAMFWFLTHSVAGRSVGPRASVWSVAMSALLGAMFLRGLEMTRKGAAQARQNVKSGLKVDLLRIEQLYPFGHSAARTSTIWFTVSAATLLLLVGTELGPVMVALSVVSAGIGGWVFFGALGQIRRAIRDAKATELEQIRHQIAELKTHLHADPAAPAKLQSLLAYEARIAAVHEWPFDQTTFARMAASSLVLTVPWFGQAFAGAVVARFSALIR